MVIGLLLSSSLDDFSGLEIDTALPTEEDYVVYDDGMEPLSKHTLCFLITRPYFNSKCLILIAFVSGSDWDTGGNQPLFQAGSAVAQTSLLPASLLTEPCGFKSERDLLLGLCVRKYNAVAGGSQGVSGGPVPRCPPEKSRHAIDLV